MIRFTPERLCGSWTQKVSLQAERASCNVYSKTGENDDSMNCGSEDERQRFKSSSEEKIISPGPWAAKDSGPRETLF